MIHKIKAWFLRWFWYQVRPLPAVCSVCSSDLGISFDYDTINHETYVIVCPCQSCLNKAVAEGHKNARGEL
jgi:hypothetical protein